MRSLLFIATCLLIGCGNDTTKEFEALADRACECGPDDTACGTKVLSDVAKFAETHKSSDGDVNRINEAGRKIYNCLGTAGILPNQLTAALEKMVD